MKNRLTWFATLLALWLIGCKTAPPDVTSHTDAFSHQRTADVMQDILLPAPTDPPREVVWLNATRYFKSINEAPIYLGVSYMASAETGPLEIDPGQTLTIVADNQALKFNGSGSLNSRAVVKQEGLDFNQESAYYLATSAQLHRIANAKQVKVQVRGRNGLVEREFDAAAFDRFRRFVSYLGI